MHTYDFYGGKVALYAGPGNTADGGSAFPNGYKHYQVADLSNCLRGGEAARPLGGMAYDGSTTMYFMTRIESYIVDPEGGFGAITPGWRVDAISRTNVLKSGGPVYADRIFSRVWNYNPDGILGRPAIAVSGTDLYIAKVNATKNVVVYRYAGLNPALSTPTNTYVGPVVDGTVQDVRSVTSTTAPRRLL